MIRDRQTKFGTYRAVPHVPYAERDSTRIWLHEFPALHHGERELPADQ